MSKGDEKALGRKVEVHDDGKDQSTSSKDDIEKQEVDVASPASEHGSDNEKETRQPQFSPQDDPYIMNDPDLVFWDGPDDPTNPQNWPMWRKWCSILIVSLITVVIALASSAIAPGVPDIMNEFHQESQVLAGFIVSVYVLGFAVAPLVIAPMSEMYGRLPLYHACGILFTVFNIGCAKANNMTALIILRFFSGCFGSAPLALGGGTVADLMSPEQRATALSIWMLGPTLGPAIGPIVGGFVCVHLGWRWMFWICAIVSGSGAIFAMVFMRETYAIAILNKKAKKLRVKCVRNNIRSKLDNGMSPGQLFLYSIVRPTKMLIFSPIVLLLSMYVAVVYAYLYLMFTTVGEVFETQYNWPRDMVGLAFLGIGVGCFLGQFAYTAYENHNYAKHKAKGDLVPEHRLNSMIVGALCLPIGLFWYGWSVQAKVHWICPIFAQGFFGIGLLSIFMSTNNYLVDCFTKYAASAMAANTVLRSILGAVLPIAGHSLYNDLGYGWGTSVLGFIAVAFVPVPLLFIKYGQWLRTDPKFQVQL